MLMQHSITYSIKSDLPTVAGIDCPDSDPMVARTVQAMNPTQQSHASPYLRAYEGRLKGVLRWNELDAVWANL